MSKVIDIKGNIYDNDSANFFQYFGMKVVSPSQVDQSINDDRLDNGDGKNDLIINIASNGGDVFAASEIYTMAKAYKGNVIVNIQGLAASAASVIAMAGNQVNISPTAQIMIHKAWSGMQGNADDLNHEATVLDGIDASIAAAYEAKTGMSQADLLNLMSNETWLGAKDAVDKGFADQIMFVDEKEPQVVNSSSSMLPKSAINKLMNLINKAENKKQDTQQNNSIDGQPSKDLLNAKLAILMGKN